MSEKLPSYGGQAVIEGVMMRGSKSVAMAIRSADGNIQLFTEDLGGIYQSILTKIPFLRGLIMLWDSLGLGMRMLTLSANAQTGDDEKIEGPALYGTLAIGIALGLGLFVLLPQGIGSLAGRLIHTGPGMNSLFEGITRLLLFMGYLWLIGLAEPFQRVFAYHGAEHKTINAFEANCPLTPENVSQFSLEHPRCGTAFLFTLVIVSILLFSLLGPLPFLGGLIARVTLLPLLAGLAYEYLRWTAKHQHIAIVRILTWPNLALQHLTTRPPTLDMLEVAIAAFNQMRAREDNLVS